MLQGANGMIVGVANVDPHGFVRLYDAAVKGDWDTARSEQERLHVLRLITKIATPGLGGSLRGSARLRPPRCCAASSTTTVSNPRC